MWASADDTGQRILRAALFEKMAPSEDGQMIQDPVWAMVSI